jgi:hypothetical protein
MGGISNLEAGQRGRVLTRNTPDDATALISITCRIFVDSFTSFNAEKFDLILSSFRMGVEVLTTWNGVSKETDDTLDLERCFWD